MNNNGSLKKFLLYSCLIAFSFKHKDDNRYYKAMMNKVDTSINVIGIYNSPIHEGNKFTSESLILKADSTFTYYLKTEFTKTMCKGYWRKSGRNIILNSEKKVDKIIIEETLDRKSKKNQILFDVTYKDDHPLYYQLYLINGSVCSLPDKRTARRQFIT